MQNVYSNILARTNGQIYIGVVGPVRSGKSTFITRFMEKMVLPNLKEGTLLERTKDELPQMGSGNMIMTMQPRFVPSEAVEVSFGKMFGLVRLVDSVGYLIDGVSGHEDANGNPRMVKTMWNDEEIPFAKAAEIGTNKVIKTHSEVAVVVTTDGSITGLDRSAYKPAEERAISELTKINKPFVVLLNSLTPESPETINLAQSLQAEYNVSVIPVNIARMEEEDFVRVFEEVLYSFSTKKIEVEMPDWMKILDEDNEIIERILSSLNESRIERMQDIKTLCEKLEEDENIKASQIENIDLGTGNAKITILPKEELYYQTLSDFAGAEIKTPAEIMENLKQAVKAKREYDKFKEALEEASTSGYGIVVPNEEEMELASPEVIKKAGTSGLKLKAKASSYHILKVDVETEVTPAVGGTFSGSGAEEENPQDIWQTAMFGKTLTTLAHEGIVAKLSGYPKEAEKKLVKTVTKITNENKGGIICILL